MNEVIAAFSDRKNEIDVYLDLVATLERGIQNGIPNIKIGAEDYTITPLQQRILYAGIYLHLYNLVESTVTLLMQAIENTASKEIKSNAWELSELMRRQWVKSMAQTHDAAINPETRLTHALNMCNQLVGLIPFEMKLPKSAGGNWDDDKIEHLAEKLGVKIQLTPQVHSNIKRPSRDNKGPLKLIKDLRNKLAHGSISFSECGEGHVVQDLRDIANITITYLEAVIDAFKQYVAACEYLNVPQNVTVSAPVLKVQ